MSVRSYRPLVFMPTPVANIWLNVEHNKNFTNYSYCTNVNVNTCRLYGCTSIQFKVRYSNRIAFACLLAIKFVIWKKGKWSILKTYRPILKCKCSKSENRACFRCCKRHFRYNANHLDLTTKVEISQLFGLLSFCTDKYYLTRNCMHTIKWKISARKAIT